MTKEEQNQIIKDAWVRNLQKEGDIPTGIGQIYENWVLGKIQEAQQQLLQPQQQQEAQQGQEAQGQGEQQEAS